MVDNTISFQRGGFDSDFFPPAVREEEEKSITVGVDISGDIQYMQSHFILGLVFAQEMSFIKNS